MAPPLRIRIVASVDASLANVFNTMATSAKRAGKKIGDDFAAGARIGEGAYRSMPAKVGDALARTGRSGKQFQTDMGSVADGARQKFEQLGSELRKMPADLKAVSSVVQSELSKIERMKVREMLGIGPKPKEGPGFWTKQRSLGAYGAVASRIGMGAIHGAVGLGADLLHGIGVNTDLRSMMSEGQRNESLFRDISNFGYMPGTNGPNAQRVDPSELLHESHKIGQQTGFSANEVGQGLEKFVGLTGDLQLGRDSLKDMAVLSKATGSSLEEMVEAAGAASNTLGNVPNKARVLYDVMKLVSSEGKTGAILIKDMAVQMAKIASSAQMYAGDRSHTITVLGAMAQEARGRGGAASASQAATSIQQFTNVFRKRQRLDTFTGFGVKVYDQGGGIRDPQQIMTESFVAAMKGGFRLTPAGKKLPMAGAIGQKDGAKGWQNFETNLTALFGDVKAMRATAGFETVFKEAYVGKSGSEQEKLASATAAVGEEFHRLTIDMMDEKTVQEDFALAMKNSKSQVAVFNDQIQEVAEGFEKEMLPAVVALAPEMLLLAKGVAAAALALFGIKPAPAPNPRDLHGAEAQAAGQKALDIVGKRVDYFPGTRIPKPSSIERGPGLEVNGRPLAIPANAPGLIDEHAVQLAGAVAAARAEVANARAPGALGAVRRALQNARGLSPELNALGKNVEGVGRFFNVPGFQNVVPESASKAEKKLSEAESAQALARSVSEGVRDALKDGRMTVIIEEDRSKPGRSAPKADQPAMPADSQ